MRRVYIAFIDDSGSHEQSAFQVVGAVFGKEADFFNLELTLGVLVTQDLIPSEKWQSFEEFKASDLYKGNNAFQDIKQEKRYKAIKDFLKIVGECDLSIAYGAVPKRKLRGSIYGSASHIDVAFRACLPGIQTWMKNNAGGDKCLLITDDFSEKKIKEEVRLSFRQLRLQIRPPEYSIGTLDHFHDAIAFCDSRDSVGVQVADMCSYFIGHHLQGNNESKWCYDLFASRISYRNLVSAESVGTDAETGALITLPNPLMVP